MLNANDRVVAFLDPKLYLQSFPIENGLRRE